MILILYTTGHFMKAGKKYCSFFIYESADCLIQTNDVYKWDEDTDKAWSQNASLKVCGLIFENEIYVLLANNFVYYML